MIIFNHNFAAEYHAPLLPITLGLLFYVRSIGIRIALGLTLAFVLLPALSLSLARGAWVGLIGGCFFGLTMILVAWLSCRPKNSDKSENIKSFIPLWGLLALGLALPVYIITSDHWKKGAPIYNTSNGGGGTHSPSSPPLPDALSEETKELISISEVSEDRGGIARRLVLWQDALLACLNSNLLFGKGTDHYELHFHETAKLSDKTTGGTLVRFVHNDFIQTLYENGLLGLIGFLGIWVWILWKGARSCLNQIWEGDLRELGLRLGLVSGCLVFLIESFFEFPTRSPCSMVVGWTSLGLLIVVVYQKSPENSSNRVKQIGSKFNLFIAAAAFSIITYGCTLAKNVFWSNIYHFHGRIAGSPS